MKMTSRPVLMSRLIAEHLKVIDRWTVVDPNGYEGGTGVASMSEDDFRAAGASAVDWGEPDSNGRYTPTVYTQSI